MSNEKQETVTDIVVEMRRIKCLTFWADRIEAAHQREVAELRKCLNEAIREKCPFTRMSCKKGEPCDYECGTDKWRKALQYKGGAK